MIEEVKIITAEQPSLSNYIGKIWRYRSLIITFAIRDIKIRYAQSFLGFFWILLQPLPSIIIFTFLFGRLIKVNTGALPYPVFALTGMIGWNYFTNLTGSIGSSLIDSQHILKKIYFPKLILPLSKVLVGALDFTVSFLLIIGALFLYAIHPTWTIIFFPLFFLFNILTGFCIGIWLAALTFRYRDLQHVAPFVINFSIWLTPVFYPTTILPTEVSYIMYGNPMALVIEGYRYTLVGGIPPSPYYIFSFIPVLLLLAVGLYYFRNVENRIAELI